MGVALGIRMPPGGIQAMSQVRFGIGMAFQQQQPRPGRHHRAQAGQPRRQVIGPMQPMMDDHQIVAPRQRRLARQPLLPGGIQPGHADDGMPRVFGLQPGLPLIPLLGDDVIAPLGRESRQQLSRQILGPSRDFQDAQTAILRPVRRQGLYDLHGGPIHAQVGGRGIVHLLHQMAASESVPERSGLVALQQQVRQVAADATDKHQIGQAVGAVTEDRSPDVLGGGRGALVRQPPGTVRQVEQAKLPQKPDQTLEQGPRRAGEIPTGFHGLPKPPRLPRLQRVERPEGIRGHQRFLERQGGLEVFPPMQDRFQVCQHASDLAHQLSVGRPRDRWLIVGMRLEPAHLSPEGRLNRFALPQGGPPESAAFQLGHGFSRPIKKQKLGEDRTRAASQKTATNARHRSATVVAQPPHPHGKEGGAPAGLNVALEEVEKGLEAHIQQRGMEQVGVESLNYRRWGRDSGVQFFASDHDGLQPLERGAIVETHPPGHGIVAIRIQGNVRGALERPGDWRGHQGGAQQPSHRIEAPILLGQALATENPEATVGGVEFESQDSGMFSVEHDRRQDIHLLQFMPILAKPFAARRQGHLRIGRARQDHGPTDPMVREVRQDQRIQGVLPDRGGLLETIAQQGVGPSTIDEVIAFAGQGMPVAFPLPGIVGQTNPGRLPPEQGGQVQGRPQQAGGQRGSQKPIGAVIALPEAG